MLQGKDRSVDSMSMKNSVQSFSNETLKPLQCPQCGSQLHPLKGLAKAASSFEDCLRKCETCGIGFSNSKYGQTRIYRDYLDNIPVEVKAGVEQALSEALNERNRPNKKAKFGFSTSEDALTWTVFTFLRKSGQLGNVFRKIGTVHGSEGEPELLIWGVPQAATQRSRLVRERLIEICDRLGESKNGRSEPDVILDFGESGIVFIEVKYRSGNDLQDFRAKHDKYLEGTDAFNELQSIRDSRLYELARNWRLGIELANGEPFVLVNLVVSSRDSRQLQFFKSGLNPRKGQFKVVKWKDLISQCQTARWLERYLDDLSIF